MDVGVVVGDGLASIELGDTLVFLWKEPVTLPRFKWFIQACASLARGRPGGMICLDLILPESKPPTAEVRACMQTEFRSLGAGLRRLVVVPLGDSIWLSVVRTIVRAVLLLSGQSKQHVVAATLEAGIEQVQSAAGVETPSPAVLRDAVAKLYLALGVSTRRPAAEGGVDNTLRAP